MRTKLTIFNTHGKETICLVASKFYLLVLIGVILYRAMLDWRPIKAKWHLDNASYKIPPSGRTKEVYFSSKPTYLTIFFMNKYFFSILSFWPQKWTRHTWKPYRRHQDFLSGPTRSKADICLLFEFEVNFIKLWEVPLLWLRTPEDISQWNMAKYAKHCWQ